MIRLKMSVEFVKKVCNSEGALFQEEVALRAVYGTEGTVNRQWSKYTPAASLTMLINNPEAFDKVLPGQFVFVDLTPCGKDD